MTVEDLKEILNKVTIKDLEVVVVLSDDQGADFDVPANEVGIVTSAKGVFLRIWHK